MSLTQKDIENGLREIGLTRGDIVLVHSSLSSLGYVEGGADAVVDAVLSVIGHEGTMVVPVFNYAPDPFDPITTPSLTGKITETVRLRPDAVRSLHPTHSAAAIGKDAEEITRGHEDVDAFAVGSPLHKILERNGKILQIGVTHTSNSMIHVAEELAEVPYLDKVRAVTIAAPGRQTVRKVIGRPGCSRGFDKIEDRLQETGQVRETTIGDARVRLMSASAVAAAAVRMLSEDPASLLCDIPDCQVCAESRAVISAAQIDQENEMWEEAWEWQEKMDTEEAEDGGGFFGISNN